MDQNVINLIKTRRHPQIENKLDVWALIRDSYKGGQDYVNGDYLFLYPKENSLEYDARKSRSQYFNHVAPLVDMLVGFLLEKNPSRKIPTQVEYFLNNTGRGKNLDSFMSRVALHSMLYTCGVLIDSPRFNSNDVSTVAIRKERNLYPFGVMYYGWEIRDFEVDDKGDLLWILLDNSFIDKSNPLATPEKVNSYRLWTKDYYQDFKWKDGDVANNTFQASEQIFHNLGKIPFVFCNSRDVNDDYISETIFEDIANIDRSFYNQFSCMDEVLVSGSFKSFCFPSNGTGDDIPDVIMENGIGALAVIPFPKDASHAPFFAGPGIQDTSQFVELLNFLLKEMYSRVGLYHEDDKAFAQSGEAKKWQFKKTEAILKNIAEQLENTERKMFEYVCLWEGINNPDIEISYNKQFITEDVAEQLTNLYTVSTLPIKSVQKLAFKKIIQSVFKNEDVSPEVLSEINDEIDNQPEEFNLQEVINQEKDTLNNQSLAIE